MLRKNWTIRFMFCLVSATLLGAGISVADGKEKSETMVSPKDALFFDSFEQAPQSPWQWIREDPDAHRTSEKGLEIKIAQGSLMGGGRGVKNILVRPLPEEAKFVSVHVSADHKVQYEQAGMILYRDDDNYVKLVLERVGEEHNIVLVVEFDAAAKVVGKVPRPQKSASVGIEFSDGKFIVHIWDEEKHAVMGSAEFPMSPRPRVGVFTHGGEAGADRWACFQDFGVYSEVPFDK